ncbi:hypothetical protein Pth03_72330 [Planotetraspora thailandica]|uniref:Uncharacterized protein n=1 Tax=Planotetraspora thailandica TaxID=487172 RepID=A0A8J4DDV1_9ACTN|nr:hypothetical protein Pth03_72330 [Planotetraspora thailandica]
MRDQGWAPVANGDRASASMTSAGVSASSRHILIGTVLGTVFGTVFGTVLGDVPGLVVSELGEKRASFTTDICP